MFSTLFAQTFNFHDQVVQLRLAGLIVLAITIFCLALLELGNIRNKKLRKQLVGISAAGCIAVFLIAYISAG